ncbi:MAG: (2Fe-2S)-binding protein [Elusimicrobia bacterium]|nr:(2Fe-2S)-binding protein [Elusimicrobiota bacterium]
MEKINIKLTVNGREVSSDCEPAKTLLDFLRDDLGIKGVKKGCEIGECGACSVIMNGEAINSCMVLAPQAEGAHIITVEGLEKNGELHPLQKAFIEKGAVQCGFCTPGMLLTAKTLLDKNLTPTRSEIRKAIAGNLCRCTGYKQVVDAIEHAAKVMSGGNP